ncbi:phage tail protein [Aeromicrobium sp. CFBP 8757]|uniref:phage tail protein n=1 Tax=Aeromicrobium sp. CFBP 8757 TaxID=2775288 RepID=UPI0017807F27|nr:tail fiber protein [Aeromicrobium sp. CFBP 8757]MBD8608535.1 phage tail protein [Aeromicrobium sp. CFBP 8757]
MSEFYIGEIRAFSFGFVPKYWAECAGQLLPINQNAALFSLLGTFYGGNGSSNFALPDLRDRGPIHQGGPYYIGTVGGEETHTLTVAEMPAHRHGAAAGATASTADPTGATWGAGEGAAYGSGPNAVMSPGAVGATGGGQAHQNMPPYLPVTYAIALTGIFPPRP